ncbi:MAG: hypothetical protein BGO70_11900 [Bacteroidetes bacterium 43-93]|nr:MAG: hypothetical protein BGO70_11900 [Bacteroidetes bacterium 43-93]
MFTFFLLNLALLFFVSSTIPAFARKKNNKSTRIVSISIAFGDNTPASDLKLIITKDNKLFASGRTNGNGIFNLHDPSSGTYLIEQKDPDFVGYFDPFFRLVVTDTTKNAIFYLQPLFELPAHLVKPNCIDSDLIFKKRKIPAYPIAEKH